MFEYTNTGFIVLGGIIIFSMLLIIILSLGKAYENNTKTVAHYVAIIVIVLMVVFLYLEGKSTEETINSNIKFFKAGETLRCSTLSNSYLLSSSTGWHLHNEGFTKDSLILDAKSCMY